MLRATHFLKPGLTEVLAVWGAVLATVTFIWNLLRDLRDRPKVKLTAVLEQTAQDSFGQPIAMEEAVHGDVETHLVLTITNVGRRSVVIIGWGTDASYAYSRFEPVLGRPPNVVLTEGQYYRVHEAEPRLSVLSDSVQAIFARDSTGKNWYLPRKQLRLLREEAKNLAAEEKL